MPETTQKYHSFGDKDVSDDREQSQRQSMDPVEPDSNAKPALGQRNPAVHDFLAFEDSDDSGDFKVAMAKKNKERYEEAPKAEV